MLEVAQAAVNQLARRRRGGRGEIALFDQPHRKAAPGSIAGDPDAIDAAADHQHVKNLGAHEIRLFGKHGKRQRESRGCYRPPAAPARSTSLAKKGTSSPEIVSMRPSAIHSSRQGMMPRSSCRYAGSRSGRGKVTRLE